MGGEREEKREGAILERASSCYFLIVLEHGRGRVSEGVMKTWERRKGEKGGEKGRGKVSKEAMKTLAQI